MKYIKPKDFEDYCKNQDKLINILNHRMTQMENNVTKIQINMSWIKKFIAIQTGLLTSIFLCVLGFWVHSAL